MRMPAAWGDLATVTMTWWAVSLSGVLMPGPVSAVAVSEGIRRGTVAGPLVTAGHAVAEIAMVGALVAGLSQVLRLPAVIGTIGIVGGAVLLWMGWGIVQTARAGVPGVAPAVLAGDGDDREGGGTVGVAGMRLGSHGSLVRTGLLVTLGNPYWLLWWATVGAAYLVAFSRFGVVALVALFFTGHVALDLGWTTFLAFTAGAGKGRLSGRAYRIVLVLCGVFVMAMSGFFIYSGAGYLAGR
jgi:threonine/homoserine/homoserine lactone efflux protein